ncbi:MAG TPA: hypothetical protein VK853_06665, partial [Ilumatobacteraceae bacterium]|nr:hypothetical protein [Ilumatobacteraceae bacterium]
APPTIIVTPNDDSFRRGEVTVTIDVTDVGSGIAEVFVNGTAVTVPVGSTSFQTTVPATVRADTAGTFTVDVTATDVAGNPATPVSAEIRIDNARPEVTLTPPDADWSASNIDVTVAATDVGSGVRELCVDGLCSTDATRPVVVAAADGTFVERTITASATDGVGNVSDTVSGTYKVDKAKPVVTVTPATTAWTNAPVVVTVTASDAGSGLQSVCLDTGTGCTPISLDAEGRATTTIDTDGITTITATAKDRVGNTTTSDPATVRIDTKAPTLDIAPNDLEFRRGPVEVVVTASDALSGLASVCLDTGTGTGCEPITLDADGEFRTTVDVDGEGARDISATAIDAADNRTTATARQLIDNVQPIVTLTPPDADWTAVAVPVAVTATDTGSGVAELCVDGACGPGTSQSLDVDTPLDSVLQRTVTATATDNVGNTATAIGVYRIDKAKPVVTVTPATAAWTNAPVVVTVTATDEGSGLRSVCLDSGTGCTPISLDGDGIATTRIDTDGITSITATATDRVGNTTTTEPIEVKIDTTAPLVAITPDTPDWRNTDVTLTVTGLDLLSGVASISTTTCVDGTCSAPNVVDAATTTVAVTVPAGTARTTTVEVVVTDVAGNKTARTQTVRIDKVNPTATLSVSTDAAGTGIYNFGEEVTATFSCGDVGSGVATCELLDGTTVDDTTVIATTSPATIDTTTAGTRTLTVRATDAAGNTFVSAPVSVTVGYRFCLNYNPNDAKRAGSAVTLSIRVCDASGATLRISGLTLTALTVDGDVDPGPGAPGGSNPEYTFRFDGVASYSYTIKTTGLSRGFHDLFFTTIPVPNRSSLELPELQALATNSVPFRLR